MSILVEETNIFENSTRICGIKKYHSVKRPANIGLFVL